MSEKVRIFEDLLLWQKVHQLVLFTYNIIENFPNEDEFGLVSQMRRELSWLLIIFQMSHSVKLIHN